MAGQLCHLADKICKTANRNTYLAITLAKLGVVTALKLSPLGRGYELDG